MSEQNLQDRTVARLRSESDLLVFISSVTDELKSIRQAAKDAVLALPLARPWLFEDSPASSESPSDAYLRKVKEADIVIWLIGSETSQPVVDEISVCMSVGHPLLAFKLPSTSRDNQTQNLISDVGQYAKWKEVNDSSDLAEEINVALYDEILRRFRNPERPMRQRKVMESNDLSVSRTRQSWISIGVPDELADELSKDHTVGDVMDPPCPGLHMVVGDQGVGKTLAVERLFQRAVKSALIDSSQPFPLIVNARDLSEPLNEYVDRLTAGYSVPTIQGSFVVIDGVDEVGVSEANALIQQAAAYANASPKSVVVFTARPLPGLKTLGVRVEVPYLDSNQAADLIGRIARRAFNRNVIYTWSQSTQDAARCPLFAVMIGIALGTDPNSPVPSRSQMVDRLAQSTFVDSTIPEERSYQLLQALAVKTISNGARVSKTEISHSIHDHALLTDSRFVNEIAEKVDFTLAILREWFAARALIESTISLKDVLPMSDRWTIPIAIAMDTGDEAFANEIMSIVASSDPGLASILLTGQDPIQYGPEKEPIPLADAHEIGNRIRAATETWRDGIGDLFSLIGPVAQRGDTPTIGVHRLDDQYFHMSWYNGKDTLPPVVELPREVSPSLDWPTLVTRGVPNSKVWPWLITRTDLVGTISEWLQPGHLPTESAEALHELSWEFAHAANSHLGMKSAPIEIIDVLGQIERGINNVYFYDDSGARYIFSGRDISLVGRYLNRMVEEGNEVITDPWPSEDQPVASGWLWEGYSDEQLLKRTNAIYSAGLRIYNSLVGRWFGSFQDRLQLFQLLPVKLEGFLTPSQEEGSPRMGPGLSWRTRSLPVHQDSTAVFVLKRDDQPNEDLLTYWTEERKNIAKLRRHSYGEATPMNVRSVVNVFEPRPATTLAYKWLRADLRKCDWTDVIA